MNSYNPGRAAAGQPYIRAQAKHGGHAGSSPKAS